jgi:hypothetical protein
MLKKVLKNEIPTSTNSVVLLCCRETQPDSFHMLFRKWLQKSGHPQTEKKCVQKQNPSGRSVNYWPLALELATPPISDSSFCEAIECDHT